MQILCLSLHSGCLRAPSRAWMEMVPSAWCCLDPCPGVHRDENQAATDHWRFEKRLGVQARLPWFMALGIGERPLAKSREETPGRVLMLKLLAVMRIAP